MKLYSSVKKKLLKKKDVRDAYAALETEFVIAQMIIEKRLQRGLTQAELARHIGTKQSAIARLESGTYNPTIALLKKIADALGVRLVVSLRRNI